MRLKYYLAIISALLWVGCTGSFTPQELKIIQEGEGVMRVLEIDDQEDSLFLRLQARPLTPNDIETETFQILKQRMLATVNDSTDPGVGIAAPQVGISRQLIAVQRYDKPGNPFEFYVNPRIVYASETRSLGKEGCLSVPDVVGEVSRSKEIVISYVPEISLIKRTMSRNKSDSTFKFELKVEYQRSWERVRDTIQGFTAVIFQHEIDHLEGILFTDKMVKAEEIQNN